MISNFNEDCEEYDCNDCFDDSGSYGDCDNSGWFCDDSDSEGDDSGGYDDNGDNYCYCEYGDDDSYSGDDCDCDDCGDCEDSNWFDNSSCSVTPSEPQGPTCGGSDPGEIGFFDNSSCSSSSDDYCYCSYDDGDDSMDCGNDCDSNCDCF